MFPGAAAGSGAALLAVVLPVLPAVLRLAVRRQSCLGMAFFDGRPLPQAERSFGDV
jgi:hypothetical protein